MNTDDILLRIKNIRFEDLVCQTEVQTKEDVDTRGRNGYSVIYTLDEFKVEYPTLPPERIYYAPSLTTSCLYINYETMAVCAFPVEYQKIGFKTKEELLFVIQTCEQCAANGNYFEFLLSLPDGMRIEYIYRLVYAKQNLPSNIYEYFWSIYSTCDYGFDFITVDFIKKLEKYKKESDLEDANYGLSELPDKVMVYRGGNSESRPYTEAFSWTLDENIAIFFASKNDSEQGYVVCGEVDKHDIIRSLINHSDEKELIIAPENVRIIDEYSICGLEFIDKNLPQTLDLYYIYRDKIEDRFVHIDGVHGEQHAKRVLLLSLLIGSHIGLSKTRLRELAEAAVYHDYGRTNDDVDDTHGQRSREIYKQSVKKPKRIVEFLIEYHCLPDTVGYQAINDFQWLSKDKKMSTTLYNIFKDADALDRVRFGIKSLDISQLRLEISKELVIVAKLLLCNIK